MLYGRRFPLRLKGTVYKSYVRPGILHGSEVCCVTESEIGILWIERSMVRAICRVQFKDKKGDKDLMLMFGFNEAMVQLAMANIIFFISFQKRYFSRLRML